MSEAISVEAVVDSVVRQHTDADGFPSAAMLGALRGAARQGGVSHLNWVRAFSSGKKIVAPPMTYISGEEMSWCALGVRGCSLCAVCNF